MASEGTPVGSSSKAAEAARLARWQVITTVVLLVGYTGYYLCRVHLSVTTPLITAELSGRGVDQEAIGKIQSYGTAAYAAGKLVNGVLCDFVGGRHMFLGGMIASVLCTLVFSSSTSGRVLLASWSVNRLVQSTGWAALVKVTARWFPASGHGRVMGIISLSYLFGDALSRWFLGLLIDWQWGWRQVFQVAAAILAVIAVMTLLLLRDSPAAVGASEPAANPDNVFGAAGEERKPPGLWALLLPFARSFSFWIVCTMSFGLTMIRETFNNWNAVYLKEVVQVSAGAAAQWSALFPFVGGVSVLTMGYLTDRLSPRNRGVVMLPFLALAAAALWTLGSLGPSTGALRPLVCIAAVSFFLIGPYSLLAGVMSLDLGGKQGSSTASGLVDSAGYVGGIVAGWGMQQLAARLGWGQAFHALAGVALASAALALVYLWLQARRLRGTPVG